MQSGISENQDDAFLGSVQSHTPSDQWQSSIFVDNENIIFRIDTGADVSCISEMLYRSRFQNKNLQGGHGSLNGPDDTELLTHGFFTATLRYKQYLITENIYVLKKGQTALLSRSASIALGLVKFMGQIVYKDVIAEFPSLFHGIGKIDGEYHIQLDQSVTPYSVSVPRRIPLPLMGKVKAELLRLQELKIIRQVDQPTEWCAPIVVVPKANQDQVRICVDLTKLNNAVKRERHMLPSVDHTLGQMARASVFSKLDANSGFHQISLSKRSMLLTTFITPFGRFCYERLPFGINSGPEYFQKSLSRILEGLEGVVCLMDDIVIFAEKQDEHDVRLRAALKRLQEAGITLNRDKCVFSKDKIKFLGQVVGTGGIEVDPDKISSIKEMQPPRNISELRRFLGMVNQLGKFIPHLTDKTEPLRHLLGKDAQWIWGSAQNESFTYIKETLTTSPVLAIYDSAKDLKVTADASSYGLGSVLCQMESNDWRPVAYASRAMTPTEGRYAQIEKEALASTWACERFQDYLIGKHFTLETDHKPLVSLLGCKDIHELPPRIQRLRMRLMRYSYDIVHVPGKYLFTADTLSRAPHSNPTKADHALEQETILYVSHINRTLPATDRRLDEIRINQNEDETCRLLMKYIQDGWPEKSAVPGMLQCYWPYQASITELNGLLMYDSRIIIPSSFRLDILDKIHEGHQGISKCRDRAKQSVWWPGLSKQIGDLISQCRVCCQNTRNHLEPLVPSELPQRPWQKVGTDLFEYKQNKYLLFVDFYSRYIEIAKLNKTQSLYIVKQMKSIFARHGIPECVVSDNGPQYSAQEFAKFSMDYGFVHVTSSPGHASGNGAAERAVCTMKNLLKGTDDPYATLLNYRATPLANGYSPAELLMSRELRTKLPMAPNQLDAKTPDQCRLFDKEDASRLRQKQNFDNRHASKPLSNLNAGDEVWITDRNESGHVEKSVHPRSYIVKTHSGLFRRNRYQMNDLPAERQLVNMENTCELHEMQSPQQSPLQSLSPLQSPSQVSPSTLVKQPQVSQYRANSDVTVTRSGREVKLPARYQV